MKLFKKDLEAAKETYQTGVKEVKAVNGERNNEIIWLQETLDDSFNIIDESTNIREIEQYKSWNQKSLKNPLVSVRKESFPDAPTEKHKEVINTREPKEMEIMRFEPQELKYKTNKTETFVHLFHIDHTKKALEDYRERKAPQCTPMCLRGGSRLMRMKL